MANDEFKLDDEQLKRISAIILEPWVVEDTRTGKIYITNSIDAHAAQFGEGNVWTSQKLDYVKVYPAKQLGIAAEILYGQSDKN